ncbi:MAG: hypothetical protein Q8P18_12775 [Pseudomonadota bacterium]|nr:hypothetical protein [Pseudomonadota bacterium]
MLLFILTGCQLPFGDNEDFCTEIGCADGVSLDFSLDEPGDYEITAVVGGETVACTASLPFTGSEACTGPGYVGLNGTELPDDQQSLEGMWLEAIDAADVHLTIVRSGTTVYDDVLPLTYVTLEPNGPECGPVCESASLDVPL